MVGCGSAVVLGRGLLGSAAFASKNYIFWKLIFLYIFMCATIFDVNRKFVLKISNIIVDAKTNLLHSAFNFS